MSDILYTFFRCVLTQLSSPRPGEEPNNEVRIRGEPKLVNKLKAEIERVVSELRDRVVLAVDVPAPQHRALIGRGGRNLIEFQQKFNVQVQYPGSHSYNQAGVPENADELADVAPENMVKVAGARSAVEKAVEDLKVSQTSICLSRSNCFL